MQIRARESSRLFRGPGKPLDDLPGTPLVAMAGAWNAEDNVRVENEPQTERIERASLIDWLCVRAAHAKIKPADVSTPMTVRSDGRWAFCPGGLPEDADHLWFATGGITRTALARFPWPSEAEAVASG